MSLNVADTKLLEDVALPLLGTRRDTVVVLGVAKILRGPSPTREMTCDAYFRGHLGFRRVVTIDAVDWEGCDVIQDLNRPAATLLCSAADLVVDPGTLEHVFHVAQAMANVVGMLRVGGVAFHHSPANWFNHGFYSLCQSFFHDTYAANGFDAIRTYLRWARKPAEGPTDYKPRVTKILTQRRWILNAVARKRRSLKRFVIPQQARYAGGHWKGGDDGRE